MRLLSRKANGELYLTSFKDEDEIPSYAILSHTWNDGQELSYEELIAGTGKEKTGYDKLNFCGDRAAQDGLQYFWVDTCCINKGSAVELSTAINSMFRWYQRAVKCYVRLSDVYVPGGAEDILAPSATWKDAFQRSRWFTRGWTLQELLAPKVVEFFSATGEYLGSKVSLEQLINAITHIPTAALRNNDFRDISVEERISWVSQRKTTIGEDKAYCLLGIFEVFLPVNYGEGEEYAFNRLRREIVERRKPLQMVDETKMSSLSVSSLLPFPRNDLFVGRDSYLQSLEQWISRSNGQRLMSIYGLGGCGKSALALEFAYRVMAKHSKYLVFWIPAISRDTFELAFREIGNALHVPGITDKNADVKQLVKNDLSSDKYENWLMIVDNADDAEVLFTQSSEESVSSRLIDYLPRSDQGSILFTTRDRKTAERLSKSSVLKLTGMSESQAEAKRLVSLQISNKELLDDNDAIDKMLELLTYLPLAITQAVAFINQNDIPISEYVSLFTDADSEAELLNRDFGDPNRYEDVESTIAKTWYISFNQILQRDQLAADYLSFIACIDRINIPLSLLPVSSSKLRQIEAIGTLTGYALITERRQDLQGPREKLFDVHRLVHMASKWWLEDHGELAAWTEKVISRLQDVLPNGKFDNRDIWVNYLPHAINVAEPTKRVKKLTRASLLSRIGSCQSYLGQYLPAEKMHRQTLELRVNILGKHHLNTLASMNDLALALNSSGKYKEAILMHQQTLDLRREILEENHPDILESMNNLALSLDNQGSYKEAETIYRQSLTSSIQALGKEHHFTLVNMNNLASVLGSQGKYEEAEVIQRQNLELTTKILGMEHPDTPMRMNNLATNLHRQGKYEEAEVIYREALPLYTKTVGKEHPKTLTIMNNLATSLDRQGKHKEAEAMHRQNLEATTKILGKEHPDTLRSMSNLATNLDRQRKDEEAERLCRWTLESYAKILGKEHPETLRNMNNLAMCLSRQGKYEEAEVMCRQTLVQHRKALGKEHPHTLLCADNLATVLDNQDKFEEAKKIRAGEE